jgi:hypothetical protein
MRDRKKKKVFNQNYRKQFRVGKITLGFFGIAIFLSLSLFYLSQTNEVTAKGYDISSLEKKKQALAEEKERLQIEAARLQSIQQIQQDISSTDMIPVEKVNYVRSVSNVAVNK